MRVDVPFLAVVSVALCLLSVMILFHLAAVGVGRARIAASLLELWVLAAIWITAFSSIGVVFGAPGGHREAELGSLPARLAGLPSPLRLQLAVQLIAAGALAAHLMWSFARAGGLAGSARERGDG